MKKISMRGFPVILFVVCVALAGGLFCFPLFALFLLSEENIPVIAQIICIGGSLLILFPLSFRILLDAIDGFFSRIDFFPSHFVFYRPFSKKIVVPIEDISVYGCVSYQPQGNMMFFCTTPMSQMQTYLEQNLILCTKLFGEKKVEEMQCSEDGRKHLAITHIFINIYLNETTKCSFYVMGRYHD